MSYGIFEFALNYSFFYSLKPLINCNSYTAFKDGNPFSSPTAFPKWLVRITAIAVLLYVYQLFRNFILRSVKPAVAIVTPTLQMLPKMAAPSEKART